MNGWRMPPDAIGKYGVDYLQRASVWDGGPLANIPEESFYPVALLDGEGSRSTVQQAVTSFVSPMAACLRLAPSGR